MSEVQGKKLENSETQLRDSNQNQTMQTNTKVTKVPLKTDDQNKVDQKNVQKLSKEKSKPINKKPMLKDSSNGQKDEDLKKKRVDKNKCRCCGESTIPVILGLFNQQSLNVESNQGITMRNIRENMFQRANDQNPGNPENKVFYQNKYKQLQTRPGQNIPYIPLNYLHQIVICKRCRFKFHSTCLTERGLDCTKLQENWICSYCEIKIKELQSQNLWDYENNKKRKKDDPQPQKIRFDEPSMIKKRIGENKEIFKILKNSKNSPRLTDEERKDRFFKDYPYYRHPDGHHIAYPVYDEKDKYRNYGNIIEYKQKPTVTQIPIEYFSQLLGLQSTMNILGVNITFEVKKHTSNKLFPFLIIMLSLYWEELLSERRFEFYQRVLDPQAGAFFQLLRFMVSQQNEDEIFAIYIKIWAFLYKNIEKIFDEMDDDLKSILQKEEQISTVELMRLIQNVQESIYNLESFCLIMGTRETANFEHIMENEKMIRFYEDHPKAYINTGLCIGSDQDNKSYFWFKEHASMIFVEDKGKWGYYIDEEVYELMDSLETRGIKEQSLLKNLEALEEKDMLIPSGFQQTRYNMEIGFVTKHEICQILLNVEEMIQNFLQQRYCRWAKKDVREQFRKGLQDPNPNISFHLNTFIEGLQAIEKIELHPRFKKQESEIQESSDSEESQESEQSSSMKLARTRANNNIHTKPVTIITQVPKPAKKEKLPLPPFHELEAQLHSSRRTQTKIFFFNQHLKNPLKTIISGLSNQDLQGLYFSVVVLQLLLTDYAKKKTEMRMETKEKRKRGRKAKSQIEEELEQIKEASAPVQAPQKKDLFAYTIKYFETQVNVPENKTPEPEKEIFSDAKQEGLAYRREKRGTAGKNSRRRDTKSCPNCSEPLQSQAEYRCKKCLRVFHKECMNNNVCKICPQFTRQAASKKNNKQVFIDE